MLVGTADSATLARTLATATMTAFPAEPIRFERVTCFQLTAEMRKQARESLLPPSLHPTIPPTLSLQVWDVGDSPWGGFRMAMARISCRSGVRARGFATAVFASTTEACARVRAAFGCPARVAEVALRHGYDGIDATVAFEGRAILHAAAIDPEPMDVSDVQYTGTLNLAHTPLGLRLVQLEADHEATRVERLRARLLVFDGAAWGSALLAPYFVVSSSLASESVVFPPIRFVCKPDELAFTGTESVASASTGAA